MTITLDLPPQLEELVQRKIASGHFVSANDVIAEALRQMDEQDRLKELRAALVIAEEQIARGEYIEYTAEYREQARQRAGEKAARGHQVKSDVLP